MDVNGAANFQNDLEETGCITHQGTSILPCESEVRWSRSYRSYCSSRSLSDNFRHQTRLESTDSALSTSSGPVCTSFAWTNAMIRCPYLPLTDDELCKGIILLAKAKAAHMVSKLSPEMSRVRVPHLFDEIKMCRMTNSLAAKLSGHKTLTSSP